MKVVLYPLISKIMSKYVWYEICRHLNKHFFSGIHVFGEEMSSGSLAEENLCCNPA